MIVSASGGSTSACYESVLQPHDPSVKMDSAVAGVHVQTLGSDSGACSNFSATSARGNVIALVSSLDKPFGRTTGLADALDPWRCCRTGLDGSGVAGRYEGCGHL